MASSMGFVVSGCVVLMLAGMAGANAASSHITFSGAVLEPTCSTEIADVDRVQRLDGSASDRLTCGGTPASSGGTYSRVVTSLNAATVANDRLLDYFVSYANMEGAGGTGARLVVRTYE